MGSSSRFNEPTKSNPVSFEGKVIAVPITFIQMISVTEEFEEGACYGYPKGTITSDTKS